MLKLFLLTFPLINFFKRYNMAWTSLGSEWKFMFTRSYNQAIINMLRWPSVTCYQHDTSNHMSYIQRKFTEKNHPPIHQTIRDPTNLCWAEELHTKVHCTPDTSSMFYSYKAQAV